MPNVKVIGSRLRHLVLEGAYIPREYYVFDDRALVYLPIFKVASTSIKTALLKPGQGVGVYPDYMSIHQEGTFGHHSLLSPRQRRYFKFAFVRNPFERLVSCYEDRVRRPIYEPIDSYYFDSDYNHVLIQKLTGSYFHKDMAFSEFIRLVARIPDFLADGHFKSQYGWLHRFGRPIPDYVGRLESLTQDWQPIATRFGLPDLEQRNPSSRDDVASYFSTPGIIDIAARRYRKDLEVFGYEDAHQQLRREVATR